MTKTYIKKSQRIYEELYKSLGLIYSREKISIEYTRGVGNAIKTTTYFLDDLICSEDFLYRINNNNVEPIEVKYHNLFYKRVYNTIDSVKKLFLEECEEITDYLENEYYKGSFFVVETMKNYINSCLIDEYTDLNPEKVCETYIKKSQRIYEELYKFLTEECSGRNVSQRFENAALDVIKAINLSITGLMCNKNNNDLREIDAKDVKQIDPKKHNFYYNKILAKINEIYKTFSEQHYYYSIAEEAKYYTIEESTEYHKGMTFIFLNARKYIKSCLVEEEEND